MFPVGQNSLDTGRMRYLSNGNGFWSATFERHHLWKTATMTRVQPTFADLMIDAMAEGVFTLDEAGR
ncbi:MAG: hypothetical protein PVI39_13200, partial [Desulfobacteraceae bacterium]